MVSSLPSVGRPSRRCSVVVLGAVAAALFSFASSVLLAQEALISVTSDYYTYRPEAGDSFSYILYTADPQGNVDEVTTQHFVTHSTRLIGTCDYRIAIVRRSSATRVAFYEMPIAMDPACSGGFDPVSPDPCTHEWLAPTRLPGVVAPEVNYEYDDTVVSRCAWPAGEVAVASLTGGARFLRASLTTSLGTFKDTVIKDVKEERKIVSSASAGPPDAVRLYAEWYAKGFPMLKARYVIVEEGSGRRTTTDLELTAFSRGSLPPAWPSSGEYVRSFGIEYFNAQLGHYFLTADANEIATLDSGSISGWGRTLYRIPVYAAANPPTGSAPVCRFFSTAFAPKSSHFYTLINAECSALKHDPSWTFEGEVFNMLPPDAQGNCEAGSFPVYRLYNNGQGAAPNHRYTTDEAVRFEMAKRGWIPEGYGALGVTMCAPN